MTQLRRYIPPPLRALFDSGRALMTADLYTVVIPTGEAFMWTNADVPVTIGADTWLMGPGLRRNFLTHTYGTQGSELQIDLFDGEWNPVTVNGMRLAPWVLRGGFDGAAVALHQAFSAGPGMPWVDKLHRHEGEVSDVQTSGRSGALVTVRSFTESFNRPLPPTVFQPKCRTHLYSALCGVSRLDRTVTGHATSASNGLRLTFSHDLPQAAGYFSLGAIYFETGGNANVRRTVRVHTGGQLTLMQPLPAPVAIGDTFKIYPGCNLTLETCTAKFDNRGRFRGMPFIPPPDTVT